MYDADNNLVKLRPIVCVRVCDRLAFPHISV